MSGEDEENPNESPSKAAVSTSKPDVANESAAEAEGDEKASVPAAETAIDEAKPDSPEDEPALESKPSIQQTSSQVGQPSSSSKSALAQGSPAEPAAALDAAPTAAERQGEHPASPAAGVAGVASSVRTSAVRVSASGGGGVSVTGVPSGLAGRLSSLSATAGESLRGMMAKSSVIKAGSGMVKAEDGAGTVKAEDGAGSAQKASSQSTVTGDSTEPSARAITGTVGSPEAASNGELQVKQEPPDSPKTESAEEASEQSPVGHIKTQESGPFTPELAAVSSPERERQEPPMLAPSPASGRGVKMVKEELSPSDRRSSSYLYNDWDRTLYEKTGRPPPGEAHWSREKSAHSGGSPSRTGGTDACSHPQTSAQPRSPSARRHRPRSRRRPATSPGGRRTFDMARCRRETLDQFGRRLVYRHCFIEPEFTLRGQRIPVHGARKGSIVAAEDTYTGFALEMVTPPSEGQLSFEKAQRRGRVRKKRRKKRKCSRKEILKERALIEEQRRRLEEEGEKLEEDRIRLQETRLHLEQLEEWWRTEGLLILQRDEIRDQEEKIINALIEEECLRIKGERERLQTEWQFLIERQERQEKEEERIKEELSALDERQEELAQQERTGERRIHEMKAVFDIERRMMEKDRKKLVNEVLTCDAFREAMEDAELGGWETLSDDGRSRSRISSATGGARTQPEPGDPFANIKDSKLERLLADIIQPPPEPAQNNSQPSSPAPDRRSCDLISSEPSRLSAQLISSESDQSSVALREDDGSHPSCDDSEAPRARAMRPITARGRPARASRSTPFGDTSVRQIEPLSLSAVRSEGAAMRTATSQSTSDSMGAGGEIADIWRRRPTIMQRGDTPSITFNSIGENEVDERSPVDGHGGNRVDAMSAAPVSSGGPERDGSLRVTPAGERRQAKSEGFIDPNAKRAAAESERRRASAAPCLETRGKTAEPSATPEKTRAVDAGPQSGSQQPDVSRDTIRDQPVAATATSQTAPSPAPDVSPSVEPGAGVSAATSQQSTLRSSLRSGDASVRRVSFEKGTTAQLSLDGTGNSDADGTDGSAGDVSGDSKRRDVVARDDGD